MFGDPETNKRTIATARAKGEFDPIPYSVAKKRKPKEGRCFITRVTWEGAPEEYCELPLKSIESVRLVKPVTLPRGYEIDNHESWDKAIDLIYDRANCQKYTFEQLDLIVQDWDAIEDFTDAFFGESPFWSDRRDYLEWSGHFDDHWHHLSECVDSLYKMALPPCEIVNQNIGARTYPPSLRETLVKMLELLDSGKFVVPPVEKY